VANTWSAKEVRELRWKLGWSRADLSRRIGISAEIVAKWELHGALPSQELALELDRLLEGVEEEAFRISRRPLVEIFLKENHVTQASNDLIPDLDID
jgi:DNA-binding XRE family transcriptional regulator